jgi:hypothetical protein
MKTLAKLLAMVFAIIISNTQSFGQVNLTNHSGLYMTTNDFVSKKLSYEIDCSKETHKIKADQLFGQSKLDIIHDGKKYSYQKKDVFGFRDCNNKDFRFFNNQEFEILDGNYFYLYSFYTLKSNGKTMVKIPADFISKTAGSKIIPLTLENLKNFYPDNHKFHDMLDVAFKSDAELSLYDTYHKTYKIKHLFEQSLKK